MNHKIEKLENKISQSIYNQNNLKQNKMNFQLIESYDWKVFIFESMVQYFKTYNFVPIMNSSSNDFEQKQISPIVF